MVVFDTYTAPAGSGDVQDCIVRLDVLTTHVAARASMVRPARQLCRTQKETVRGCGTML